ncbi:MAG: type IV pilin protein [Gammaproteobacteria bacterium]
MKEHGFSLIELMIVVVIVAILAAIAVPLYTSYGKNARRTAAINALNTVASREEGYYSRYNVYATKLTELGYDHDTVTTKGGYYDISLVSVPAPATSYTVQAVPTSVGGQNTDKCRTFTLDSYGNKTPANIPHCWPK